MVAAAVVGGAVIGGVATSYSANKSAGAAGEASDKSLQTAREAEALNRERYGQSQRYLNPYLERELQASNQLMAELGLQQYSGYPDDKGAAGTGEGYLPVRNIRSEGPANYRNVPGYSEAYAALDRLEDESIETVNQGAVSSGTLYSGRRGESLRDLGAETQLNRARTENQFYNNYINTLQNLANPTSTTNLSSLGVNQAATQGAQNIAATNQANQYNLAGAQAQGQAFADYGAGLGNLASSYINYQQPSGGGVPINQNLANQTGTITPAYI